MGQNAAHLIAVEPNRNRTYSWTCTCGAEADEFEDYDSADINASEHLRDAQLQDGEAAR